MFFAHAHAAEAVSAPECRPLGSRAPTAYGRLSDCRGEKGSAPYYLHLPAGDLRGAPVLVVVHGISRNARQQMRAFGDEAARRGFVTIAPRFSRERFPGYQRLGYCKRGREHTPQAALAAILDRVHAATGADTSSVFLFGFSGGAQFSHRFALCMPGRVRAMVLGSAGWYTFPDTGEPFPRGVGAAPLAHGYDLARLLAIPTLVVVGDRDTRRDGAFNASRALDAQQGRTRIERGERWIAAMQSAAERAGLDDRFSFTTLHTCGHNFRQCAVRGGIVSIALDFYERELRRAPAAHFARAGAELSSRAATTGRY